jgi:MoxR-like ATPase
MATQNPIEQEGTYTLPEAQVDRFMFKIKLGYGSPEDEFEIAKRSSAGQTACELEKVLDGEKVLKYRKLASQVHLSDKVRQYIVDVVFATRKPSDYGLANLENLISFGASPRATINLETASKVYAAMLGRAYVIPQDIKDIGQDILRHRILLSYEAEAENISSDDIVTRIFDRIDVP